MLTIHFPISYSLMMDCVPDTAKKRCINCGWQWKRDTPFPRNECTNPPDLRPAADKLGLPDPIPPGMAQWLAVWVADGCPELSQEELDARDAVCINCDDKRPRGWGFHDDRDTCNSKVKGCGGGGYRPPLSVMLRLPKFRCPARKWPGDIEKAEATTRNLESQ